jgi:mannose-1-phosphate guanylyltransferase
MDAEMKALILAGGLGSRLQPLLRGRRPKPMAQIRGKPFLEYQIDQLRAHGFEHLVLCVGHLAHQIQDYPGDGRDRGVQIAYAVENELLGTAGATKNAQNCIEDTFLVLNGDSYLEANFRELREFHQRQRSADPRTIGTIATVAVDDATSNGKVELNSEARLVYFREKGETGPGWINGGVCLLEPGILDFIPTDLVVSAERETFPLVFEQNHYIFGYRVGGFIVDIGTPQGYRRFCQYVEEGVR